MFYMKKRLQIWIPLENLSDTGAAAVYARLPKAQQKLYRELVCHHCIQMKLHDVMVPTYKQVQSIIFENFSNIPVNHRDLITQTQRRILAEE